MRAMHVAVVMVVAMGRGRGMAMVVIVVAVRAMDMGLLGHLVLLRNKIAGNYLTPAIQTQVMTEE